MGLAPRQGDVLLPHQPFLAGSAPQHGPILPVSDGTTRSGQRPRDLSSSNTGKSRSIGSPASLDATGPVTNMTRQKAFDNPVSLEAQELGEWPLEASMDRKKLRRISSALKDQPSSPLSPSAKTLLPGDEEELQQEPHLPHSPHQAQPEKRAQDVQPASPSRYSATAGAGPSKQSNTAESAPRKHSATAGARSSAPNRPTSKGGDSNEAEAQRNTRQQAVDQLKAMLQSDPRVTRRKSADTG